MLINKIKYYNRGAEGRKRPEEVGGKKESFFFLRPAGKKGRIRIGYLVEYSLHNGQKISKYINKISFLFLSLPARIKHGSELSQIIFFISYLFSSLCPFYFLFIFRNNIFFLSLFKFYLLYGEIGFRHGGLIRYKRKKRMKNISDWTFLIFFWKVSTALSISLFDQRCSTLMILYSESIIYY